MATLFYVFLCLREIFKMYLNLIFFVQGGDSNDKDLSHGF